MEPLLAKRLQSALHLKQTRVAEWSAPSPSGARIDGSAGTEHSRTQEVWWSLLRAIHRCTGPAPVRTQTESISPGPCRQGGRMRGRTRPLHVQMSHPANTKREKGAKLSPAEQLVKCSALRLHSKDTQPLQQHGRSTQRSELRPPVREAAEASWTAPSSSHRLLFCCLL